MLMDELDEEEWEDWDEDDSFERERIEAENRAAYDSTFDYYSAYRPKQPKLEIGQYVADQGFRVPFIHDQAEWEQVFDDGAAMLRSEMPQDYDGLSGLLPSERVADAALAQATQGFGHELGSIVMRGLRNGDLDPTDYMTYLSGRYSWSFYEAEHVKSAAYYGALEYLDMYQQSASRWRAIEGTNVSVFADPHVEGRYYFGVKPYIDPSARRYQAIGGYQFDQGEYDTPKQFRKHDTPFVARQFVEFYEQIRQLPRFDATQCPVLELQQDLEGNIHFLQYLKTGQKQMLSEPFDLPSSEDTLRTFNTRGITPRSGKNMRLYMAPNLLKKGMEGEGIFCSLTRPRGIETQFASVTASFILHQAYISFQNNHFDASPLYRPSLAASLSYCENSTDALLVKIDEVIENALFRKVSPFSREAVPYLNIKVTSNGHETAIESDWNLNVIAYDDIK